MKKLGLNLAYLTVAALIGLSIYHAAICHVYGQGMYELLLAWFIDWEVTS